MNLSKKLMKSLTQNNELYLRILRYEVRAAIVATTIKVRLHDATKLMRYATCNKIALCKRAYLCDMRLLHAVAGKWKSSNFLATIACRNKPVYIVRF